MADARTVRDQLRNLGIRSTTLENKGECDSDLPDDHSGSLLIVQCHLAASHSLILHYKVSIKSVKDPMHDNTIFPGPENIKLLLLLLSLGRTN